MKMRFLSATAPTLAGSGSSKATLRTTALRRHVAIPGVTRRTLSTLGFVLAVLILPNTPAMGQVSAYVRSDGVNAVVFRGSSNSDIWEYSLVPGTNWQRGDLFMGPCGRFPFYKYPVAADSDPMGYVRHDGVNAVVYTGTDHYIHEQSLWSGRWCPDNLSTYQNVPAPPAAPSAKPWAYKTGDNTGNTSAVLYRGQDPYTGQYTRIYQLELTGGTWQLQDVFANEPATPAASDPVSYNGSQVTRAVFIGTNGHVYQRERTFDPEGAPYWHSTDLTDDANKRMLITVPLAAQGTKPTAFINQQGSNVAFTGTDGHVYLLMQAESETWYPLDLTPNAPPEYQACSSPFEYKRSDQLYVVIYSGCSTSSYIYELASSDGWNWPWWSNLDAAAGGGAWAHGDPVAYVRSDGTNSVVYPEAFSTWIAELTYQPGGYWQFWSLTYR